MNRVINCLISLTGRPLRVPPVITSLTRRITLSNGSEDRALITTLVSISIMTLKNYILFSFTITGVRLPSSGCQHSTFRRQFEAETRRPMPQVLEDPFSIRLLIMLRAEAFDNPTLVDRAVEDDGQLAGRGGDGFGRADSSFEPTTVSPQPGIQPTAGQRGAAQSMRQCGGGLAGATRTNLPRALLDIRRQTQPGRKVILRLPRRQVPARVHQERTNRKNTDAINLGQIHAEQFVQTFPCERGPMPAAIRLGCRRQV